MYDNDKKNAQILDIVERLCISVPVKYQEEVRTELLFFGMKLRSRDVKYIFVCLRNRKIDLVRTLHKQFIIFESTDGPDGTADCAEQLEDEQDLLDVLQIARFLTSVERYFLVALVRVLDEEGEIDIVACSKMCNISTRRGYQVINQIREIAKSTWRPDPTNGINNLKELYERLVAQS